MPVVAHRYDTKPKVNQEGIHYPAYQGTSTTSVPSVFSVPIQPAVSPQGFNSRNTVIFDLETAEVGCIESAYFRIKVSSVSDLELSPCMDWFEDILIEESKGIGLEISRIYPLTCYMWLQTMYNEEERENCAYNAGLKLVKNCKGEIEVQRDRDRGKIYAGRTNEYWLPLPVAYFHMGAIDMRHVFNDLRIKLRLAALTNFVIESTATDLVVEDVTLMVNSLSQLPYDDMKSTSAQQGYDHGYVFLDTEQLIYNNKTLNVNAKMKYDLDTFVGKAAAVAVVVKNGTEPLAEDRYRWVDLTDDALLDLETSSGVSLYGEGTAVPLRHIKGHLTMDLMNRQIRGINVLSFSESLQSAFSGVINGFHQFIGNKTYFTIDFPDAPIPEVHSIAITALPDAGTYNFSINGTIDQSVNYSHPVSVMKDEFEKHPAIFDKGYSVTFDQNFDAGSVVTATYDAKDGELDLKDKPAVVSGMYDSGTSVPTNFFRTTVTTRGRDGWVSGSNYQTELYMFKYRELVVTKDGRLLVRDL